MDNTVPTGSRVNAATRKDSLIVFPSPFPIKVMGLNVEALVPAISMLAHRFDPSFDAASIELRPSSAGNYLGVTITVLAISMEQLDGLYEALTSHELVKVVL